MKASEIREMTYEEVLAKLQDAKEELFNLRFQKITGELSNPKRIRQVKRDIARLKTLLNEHRLGITKLASGEEYEQTER